MVGPPPLEGLGGPDGTGLTCVAQRGDEYADTCAGRRAFELPIRPHRSAELRQARRLPREAIMVSDNLNVTIRSPRPPDPMRPSDTGTRAALRRCIRCCLIVLIAGAQLAFPMPARSHEAEQYTLPAGRDFADLGPYFSKIMYDAVVAATADTNAAIARATESGQSQARIDELQSAEHIAGTVWAQIFAAIPANELLDATLVSEAVQSRYPGLVTMYRPPVSIYDDPLLAIDLTKAVRTFFRAGTVSAGEHVFGTDKIIHFINVGRIYHGKYETRIRRGLPEKEAIKSAIASTSRNPLTSESGVLGMLSTGILSNGDLAADYAGLMFYRNLTETVRIGPRTLPPMLERDGPYWRVRSQPGPDFFVAFVTPHWNEVLNPNKYARYTSARMRALVRERCPQALDWYRDPRGQRRDRAQFEAIERELATYYGNDYGHQGNPAHPVTIADICFPTGPNIAVSARDEREATASRNETGNDRAPGPDALGRTSLWWAAREGNVAQVRLLAAGQRELDLADVDGETPLHAATRAGSMSVVHELTRRGADPNRASLYGVTPLMLAADLGRTDVAEELLRAGASPNARDLFGETALHVAALRGNRLLTDRLFDHGADPRIASDGGNTALHLAASQGHETVVLLLVARGADTSLRNDAGATPHDEAIRNGHETTSAHLLLDAQSGAAVVRLDDEPGEHAAAGPGSPDQLDDLAVTRADAVRRTPGRTD